MSTWAKPGVKCVCICQIENPKPGTDLLVVGKVYTVVSVRRGAPNGKVGIELEEAVTDNRWGYWIARFRPVLTRTQEQDLAIFRPLLETAGEDA